MSSSKVLCEWLNVNGPKYGFSVEEAKRELGVVEDMKCIPLPFSGVCDENKCIGVKQNHGLYTQCDMCCDSGSLFCKKHLKESEKGEIDTMRDRMKCDMFSYKTLSGKSPIKYIKLMKKLNISEEEVREEAKRKNVNIDDRHFAEDVSAKKGRPKVVKEVKVAKQSKGRPRKEKKVVEVEELTDIFASMMVNALSDSEVSSEMEVESESLVEPEEAVVEEIVKVSTPKSKKESKKKVNVDASEKEAKKAALEAEKEAKKAALEAEKEAKKAALEAEKEAKKAALEAEKEAKKAALEAEKEAKKAEKEAKKKVNVDASEKEAKKKALEAEKEAKKAALEAEKEAKKTALEAEKEAKKKAKEAEKEAKKAEKSSKTKVEVVSLPAPLEEEEEVEDHVVKIVVDGTTYLKSTTTGIMYNMEQEEIGKWNQITKSIDMYEEDSECEEEDNDECQEEVYDE
jgi:hypothetical protein